jgi:hypothetical protein
MKDMPIILHIDLDGESISKWLKNNRYIIYSELIRYSKKLLNEDLESVQAIMVSNVYDNLVFVLKRKNLNITLKKCMDYFMEIEEYEKCAEIRDLYILIQNLENETINTENSRTNKRLTKRNR